MAEIFQCDICFQDDRHTNAEVVCDVCKQLYCSKCKAAHGRVSSTARDRMVKIRDSVAEGKELTLKRMQRIMTQ